MKIFVIEWDDLTDEAQHRFLELIGDFPAYGPLAEIHVEEEDTKDE